MWPVLFIVSWPTWLHWRCWWVFLWFAVHGMFLAVAYLACAVNSVLAHVAVLENLMRLFENCCESQVFAEAYVAFAINCGLANVSVTKNGYVLFLVALAFVAFAVNCGFANVAGRNTVSFLHLAYVACAVNCVLANMAVLEIGWWGFFCDLLCIVGFLLWPMWPVLLIVSWPKFNVCILSGLVDVCRTCSFCFMVGIVPGLTWL